MSDAIRSASATVWAWRLIIFKCFNNWFTVVAMALFAQDFAWTTMTGFQRTRLVVLALIAGAKSIEAFLNQDLGQMKTKIAADLATGNTQQFIRVSPLVTEASLPVSTTLTTSQTFTPNTSTEIKTQ